MRLHKGLLINAGQEQQLAVACIQTSHWSEEHCILQALGLEQ